MMSHKLKEPASSVKKQGSSLESIVKSTQDIMRQDTGVDGDAQRISQLVWMIFLKIFDDKEREYELDDRYVSPLPDELRWRNWAGDEDRGLTGDDLHRFINGELFERLKAIDFSSSDPRGFVVGEVFRDAYNFMKSGTLIRQIINKINQIDFTSSQDRHVFNDIYEKILRDLQSAGNAAEYYTPRPVTKFMVGRVKPRLGERVLDMACGTGGFLVNAIEYMQSEIKSIEDRRTLQQNIIGYEKKPLPHLLCITNMLLHGIEVPVEIHRGNLLARPLVSYGNKERVEVIVTNPPFGGIEESGIEKNFPATLQTKETADLFLVLMTHLLKSGGRGAIVLPDGSLFGEGGVKTRAKEKFFQECNLHTVVRLPHGVFSPYTPIKTNLLFVTKGEPTGEIWFYELPPPEGRKNYTKTTPVRDEDFEECIEWWDNRVESDRAWKYDFRDVYNKALAEATPYWEAAKEAEERAKALERDRKELEDDIKRLRASLRTNGTGGTERAEIQSRIEVLSDQCTLISQSEQQQREAAKEAKASGDEAYDPAFNIDIPNPSRIEVLKDLSPPQLIDDILSKEQRIATILSEIKQQVN